MQRMTPHLAALFERRDHPVGQVFLPARADAAPASPPLSKFLTSSPYYML